MVGEREKQLFCFTGEFVIKMTENKLETYSTEKIGRKECHQASI
jgi:hypothetical protein